LSRTTLADGQLSCRLVSEPNEPHALEASEDLIAWVILNRFDTTNSVQTLLAAAGEHRSGPLLPRLPSPLER
jgi:hypothetical protein